MDWKLKCLMFEIYIACIPPFEPLNRDVDKKCPVFHPYVDVYTPTLHTNFFFFNKNSLNIAMEWNSFLFSIFKLRFSSYQDP